ncbi:hypothetical protein FIBSPDRAFT_818578 [Athelia psychrophila]|uniref:UBX domain-containing protein n=1 Tax=Athelia psychrophila TaxID=1759441 RepID=A0A166QPQ6_9AGAM|nr:hypothetical protein FIBSPDRAFT_818578 [Fibularhizoctonia sp. CBS 109695]
MAESPSASGSSHLPANATEDVAFKLYRPSENSQSNPNAHELPESYFTPTITDMKLAHATLSGRTQSLVNAPLQLRAKREATEKLKRDRWPNTTIRVRFTDRTQLEKTFPSTDKIRSVYAFVRSSLREDVKPIKFVLYQAPPKREFKVSDPEVRNLSLTELHLAPSSVLLLRFEDDALNGSDVPAPLLESILAQAIDLPAVPDFTSTPSSQADTEPASVNLTTGPKKIPKWLQATLRKK